MVNLFVNLTHHNYYIALHLCYLFPIIIMLRQKYPLPPGIVTSCQHPSHSCEKQFQDTADVWEKQKKTLKIGETALPHAGNS